MTHIRSIFVSLALLAVATPALAAETKVAVVANFAEPAKEIAAGFAKATGHHALLSFAASGALYEQIVHKAPFEIFLSSDNERPKKAEQDGIAVKGTRFTYAIGQLALYSTDPRLIDNHGAVLHGGHFTRLAIADPAISPYGVAAVQTMQTLGVYSADVSRIVKGTSTSQAFHFIATGAAQLGFVAVSQVIHVPGGSRWIVPKSLHAPIEHQAILLRTGANNPAAKAFLQYLRSPAARRIIKRYGYETR